MTANAITPTRRPTLRTLRGTLLGLGALLAFGACVTGAEAQVVFGYGYARPYPGPAFFEDDLPPVSPRAVVYRLQDRGFSDIARPRFDGNAWVVDATNPAGARVRLFVDARTGGIVGRQRLDVPYYPGNRVARPAPGYGWTEDEAEARARNPDRLVPPGNIPSPGYGQQAAIDRVPPPPGAAPKTATRPLPGVGANAAEANPSGINPDAKGDKTRAQAPRKTAKLTPPAKPAAPRTAPEAPRPAAGEQAAPVANPAPEPANAATQPEPSRSEPPKSEAAKSDPPAAVTPASNQPAAQTPAAAPNADKPAAEQAAAEKPAAKDWQDPPAGEPKRNVRVIGGATVVPGGGPEAPAGAN